MKALRRYFRTCPDDLDCTEPEQVAITTALSHLEWIEGELEFENSDVNDYEL